MEKINIAEILKDCPKGMELDCTMYDGATLDEVSDINCLYFPIQIRTGDGHITTLTKYGQFTNSNSSKCVIFPKGKTTWDRFQRPFKDGDVVYVKTDTHDNIIIYKKLDEHLHRYVNLSDEEIFYCDKIGKVCTKDKIREIRLATEEEKQKLFDAIKANGYKWNPKTKTLEELIEPEFNMGDVIRYKRGNRVRLKIESININEQFYYTSDKGRVYFKHQDDWEFVPNKFDITTLKPFESRVLVRDYESHKWNPAIWGLKTDDTDYPYTVVGGIAYCQCIPYEGNEHLLGTSNKCDDFYKTWEE